MATSDYAALLNDHYGRQNLAAAILDGLRVMGKDPDRFSPDDLMLVDQFHILGKDATLELARLADIQGSQQVLDVGGGLGGPARTLAAEVGCQVTVLDLTEEYCRVGEMLTVRTGLSDRVTFQHGNALALPFPDESFDVVWTQHSSGNIPDKELLYAEIHRVLRPGGRLALHDPMAGPVQPLHFPAPHAADPALSFLLPADTTRALIGDTGFRELAWVDVTAPSIEWFRHRILPMLATGTPPPLGPHLLLGALAGPAFQNMLPNLEEARVTVIEAVFEWV